MGTDSLFPDVVTGKPLSDLFMLEQTLHFFQPGGIILTTFVFPLDFFFLIAWLEERRKLVLNLHKDLLCLVPKRGSYSPNGRRAAMSCSAVREWNKGRTPTSHQFRYETKIIKNSSKS